VNASSLLATDDTATARLRDRRGPCTQLHPQAIGFTGKKQDPSTTHIFGKKGKQQRERSLYLLPPRSSITRGYLLDFLTFLRVDRCGEDKKAGLWLPHPRRIVSGGRQLPFCHGVPAVLIIVLAHDWLGFAVGRTVGGCGGNLAGCLCLYRTNFQFPSAGWLMLFMQFPAGSAPGGGATINRVTYT
jgi:hypothetical protein